MAEVATMTFLLAQALYYGPTPVPEATEQCRRHLADSPENRLLEASVTTVLAALRAMEGEFDEARSMFAHARDVHEELGRRVRIATVGSILAAEIEQLAGQPQEAVSILRWAYETVNEMGAMSATATIAGFFADALALDGQKREAEELARFAEEHAPASDVVTQVLWRMARARAEADPVAAGERARDALTIARATDYPDLQARAAVCLAQVIGPSNEQTSLLAEARRLCDAKGNIAAAARLPARSPAPS